MNILWLIPPLEGFPNISQYRFFKRMPIRATIIYPYLAASGVTLLNQAGHKVVFMDCPTQEKNLRDLNGYLLHNQTDLIVMEARTPIMKEIWKMISLLKSLYPKTLIALYGDHVSWAPQESLLQKADYIILGGDFDWGILKLVEQLSKGHSPSRIFNAGLVEDLDQLAWVDRKLVDWHPYFESWKTRDVFLWTMSGRGCPYPCISCAWAGTLWDHKLRKRSPMNMVAEIKALHGQYGDFQYLDDADLFDTRWGVEFAKGLLNAGLTKKQVKWGVQTHPNMITNLEDLKLMKAAGLDLVKLGLESGNQITLNLMKKNCTIQQSEKAVKLLKKAKIGVHANIMVGFPWEDRRDAYHTVEWIKELAPDQAQFSMLIPYPNTELFQMAAKNGCLTVKAGDWEKFDASRPMLSMKDLNAEEIIKLYQDSWSKFYLDKKFMWKQLKRIRSWSDVMKLYHGFRSVVYGHMRAVDS